MDKPILFSSEMVKAILDGSKTQTRRVIKPQPDKDSIPTVVTAGGCAGFQAFFGDLDMPMYCCPYGQSGDHLWVRETFCDVGNPFFEGVRVYYKATDTISEYNKWRPSIFMPRKYSRIMLEVVSVRVERVQEISHTDVCAEGGPFGYSASSDEDFRKLWNSINSKRGYGWDTNPFVWVIEFRKVD